jgi:hypothetical protein
MILDTHFGTVLSRVVPAVRWQFVGKPEVIHVGPISNDKSLIVESEARGGKACTERGVFARFRFNDLKS